MMRKFEAVTTFNAEGYELYGRRMIKTFCQHWPEDIQLTVYHENFDLPAGGRVTARDLNEIEWLQNFKHRHRSNGKANGYIARHRYDYRWDAVRFVHKTAAVIDACSRSVADVLIWIDGDTVTHARPDMAMLDQMLGNRTIAWLDRAKIYPECGFYMINLVHLTTDKLINHWKRLYETDEVFRLKEWHDSYVFQQAVHATEADAASLSGDAKNHPHPAINGPLGSFLDHMKGPRKKIGKSKPGDLRRPRKEEYWK